MSDLRAAVEGLEPRNFPLGESIGRLFAPEYYEAIDAVLALIPEGAVLVTAEQLGYAMDRQDEIDARIGVLGQGRKAERIIARIRET